MLSFSSYALFAQTDTIPNKDSIPTTNTDSIPKKDTTAFNNAKANLIAFSFAQRDTVPTTDTTGTDTTKKDSTLAMSSKLKHLNTPLLESKFYISNTDLKNSMKLETAAEINKNA